MTGSPLPPPTSPAHAQTSANICDIYPPTPTASSDRPSDPLAAQSSWTQTSEGTKWKLMCGHSEAGRGLFLVAFTPPAYFWVPPNHGGHKCPYSLPYPPLLYLFFADPLFQI